MISLQSSADGGRRTAGRFPFLAEEVDPLFTEVKIINGFPFTLKPGGLTGRTGASNFLADEYYSRKVTTAHTIHELPG